MRGRAILALVLALCLAALACMPPAFLRPTNTAPVETLAATEPPATTEPPAPTPTPVPPTAVPTATPTLQPVPTAAPSPTPLAEPRLSPDDVQLFPWPLFEGDRISLDVSPVLTGLVTDSELAESAAIVTLDGMGPLTTTLRAQGLDGVPQARFYWFAELPDLPPDTSVAPDGSVTMTLTVTLLLPESVADADPGNNTVVLQVPVGPRAAMPPPEPAAQWAVTETVGVRLHYLTGSAAERDLTRLLDESLAAYEEITAWLGESDELVDIYLLDRVIGQGGYASSQWVAISYPDRGYSPVELGTVLRHELTHRLDAAIGCTRAPSLVREGLAVYLAGGHYRPEPLRAKAAGLLGTPHYIPLDLLPVDFYIHQHEVAYLEAAAVIGYIVETQGWEALIDLCQATLEAEGDDAARWQAGLTALGFESSSVLEERLWEWLREDVEGAAGYDPALLKLELRLMEAMREYQTTYDPVAHFLQGILFSPAEGARLGIVADFVRRPRDPLSIGFELILAMGQEAVDQQDAARLAVLVEDLEVALAQGPAASFFVRDAVEITERALSQGWEPNRLLLISRLPRTAGVTEEWPRRYLVYALDRDSWPEQSALTARRVGVEWELRAIPGVP
jgi:hypothetical protein